MAGTDQENILADIKKINPLILVSIILLVNFLLRIFIWSNTELFRFADYVAYLDGIDTLIKGENQYLLNGNFLFGISYLGFFAEKFLGSLDYFFVFNCLIASLTELILYFLVVKITGMPFAGIITVVIQTFYTEYMVFSSVYYTPVIMIFLLSLFILLSYFYLTERKVIIKISSAVGIILIFLMSFFFKPELQYLPWFLGIFSLFFIRINRLFFLKILSLSFLLLTSYYILNTSGIITHPANHANSNSFLFFGHTDYGGDGGEGAFVYPENKIRYETALTEYLKTNNITSPTAKDYNSFQRMEMYSFITQHPLKWVNLQFTKFFRTFGVVPETTSFKILYSGLFKRNLWLTSIVVVVPVSMIIILFILFFNLSEIKQLFNTSIFQPFNSSTPAPIKHFNSSAVQNRSALRSPNAARSASSNAGFLYLLLTLFIYYLLATIFFGQYQERYRMPVMVLFIIPALGYFIVKFEKKQFLKKTSLIIKGAVIVLFITVWSFQARKAILNKERFENAIESVKGVTK